MEVTTLKKGAVLSIAMDLDIGENNQLNLQVALAAFRQAFTKAIDVTPAEEVKAILWFSEAGVDRFEKEKGQE